MSIYEKPVHLLMKEFVSSQNIKVGQIISREHIISWFKTKYSKIKKGTISAHLLRMSVNAPSRVHYNVNPNGEDDLFFQIDSGHFRLYEAETDPTPIYSKGSSKGDTIDEIGDTADAAQEEVNKSGFAYESDLRNFLSKNLKIIEPGLHLYEDEGITGIEFPVGGRFIDILALDQSNNYVVIELKVSRGYDRVIGQLLRYIAWIEKNQAEITQKVRGVIIAREISEDLSLASSKIPEVELFEYDLSVSLRKVPKL
jgi:endonuclease